MKPVREDPYYNPPGVPIRPATKKELAEDERKANEILKSLEGLSGRALLNTLLKGNKRI